MVMHARKQPKLNDGYADRKDTHLHQDMQYHSSLFADDSDDDGPLSGRVSSRYQNKSSYIERNKEKRGSLSLAEKKVSHYLATGSLGRPIPLETSFTFSGEHSSATGIPDSNRPMPSSSGQRKERSGSQGERGLKDYNSQSGSKSEHKSSTPSSSSSQHHQAPEHTSRSSTLQHPAGGDCNSHSEKDNKHSASSSAANNGRQTGKDKEQVQKSALRVCGDWSEHISSSGKRYYYNCKTEVSQWEKPKEWNSEMCKTPDHRSKDSRPRVLSQSHANKISAESRASRHSSSSEHQPQVHCINSGDTPSESQPGRDPTLSNTHQHYNKDFRESRDSQQSFRDTNRDNNSMRESRDTHKTGFERTRPADSSSSSNSHSLYLHHQAAALHRSGSTPGGNNGLSDPQHMDYKRLQHEGQYSSHMDYKRLNSEVLRRRRTDSQGSQRYHDTGQGPIDDMDISPSPSPSPSSSRPSSTSGTPQLPPTSTPVAVSTTPAHNITTTPGGNHRSSSPLGNPIPTLVNRQTVSDGGFSDKTIQTLQELQKVLSMHIRAQQNTSNIRPPGVQSHVHHSSVPTPQQGTTPQHLIYPTGQGPSVVSGPPMGAQSYQGLQAGQVPASAGFVHGTPGEDGLGGRTSPVSATSSRSSCDSPTPSDSSSQNAAVTSQALAAAAAMKREETAKLTASLSNYYNEKLIGHVLGWQADLLEKQSGKLWEESMVNGSEQCSKISVQLKRARSQVRIAEIQSTLHEQRIMSSEQQRQEIENLKAPFAFLPS